MHFNLVSYIEYDECDIINDKIGNKIVFKVYIITHGRLVTLAF
jgi:hypothetical protein